MSTITDKEMVSDFVDICVHTIKTTERNNDISNRTVRLEIYAVGFMSSVLCSKTENRCNTLCLAIGAKPDVCGVW
jgi:hypothetical protein